MGQFLHFLLSFSNSQTVSCIILFPAGTDQSRLRFCFLATRQTCTTRSTPPPKTDPELALRSPHSPAHLLPAVFAQRIPQEFVNGHPVPFERRQFVLFLFFQTQKA